MLSLLTKTLTYLGAVARSRLEVLKAVNFKPDIFTVSLKVRWIRSCSSASDFRGRVSSPMNRLEWGASWCCLGWRKG